MKPIPTLRKRRFSLRNMSFEVLIGLSALLIFLMRFVFDNASPLIGIPAVLAILVMVINLLSPSSTNESYSTFDGFIIYFKYIFNQNNRQSKTRRTDRVMLNIKNFFNRGEMSVARSVEDNGKRIRIESLEDSGLLSIGSETYVDKSNHEYAVFIYEYKDMVGINYHTDDDNHASQVALFNSLEGRNKLSFPFNNNNALNATHSFLMEELEITDYAEEIEEMMLWIAYYSEIQYPVKVIEIEVSDLNSFIQNSNHLDLQRLEGDQLISYLYNKQTGGEEL